MAGLAASLYSAILPAERKEADKLLDPVGQLIMASDLRLKEQLPLLTQSILATYTKEDRINHLGHCPLPKYDVVVEIHLEHDHVADVIDDVWDAHNADLELSGVIVNRVPAVSSEADRRYDELVRIVGKKAIWQPVVPQRVIVNQAIGERRSVHSYGSRATDVSAAFDALWAKLRRAIR